MSHLDRRQFLAGTAATVMLRARPVGAQTKSATLRFIPHADLKILDPVWTTAYITRNHSYMIYDTLFGTDEKLQIRPQMIERWASLDKGLRWSFTLRDGLKFHDGQPVVAEDAVASLKRWSKRDPLGKLLAAHTSKLMALDKKTFTLELGQPFGLVLEALGKPSSNVPFIMPARIAATSESEQIKEFVGSGPFRFVKDEWQPGNQVVYVRHDGYVPRNEPPSGSAGGKRVAIDRVVWRYIPDAATAGAALDAGEVDWWENPPLDFVPRIEANPSLATFVTDPRGTQGWVRPNHVQPPFNNKKARQALLYMVDQQQYLQAAIGQPKFYRTCPALFSCGGPWETAAGAPARPDLARARELVKDSGYDGKPVVVLDPTDIALTHGAALVTRELMTQIGFNVDLQSMDWSTVVARRAKKDPPAQGGWNVLFTWWIASDVINPAVHAGISGAGAGAWFGWPESGRMEELKTQWVRATDRTRQKQLAEEIQKLAYDEVMYVPFGQWVLPTAYRKTVQGVLQFPAPLFWNVSVT
jgi:peptide/nickel transport system substrate-binding protein